MGYASLAEVKSWLTETAGSCDDDKLTSLVNKCRQFLFNNYERLALFRDAVECFEVQNFCENCNPCRGRYRGITLPRYMQTVEAMWYGSTPIALQSSWREYQHGIASECACGLEKFDMPAPVPTERDIIPNQARRLKVLCMNAADAGKKVIVSGKDAFGDRTASEAITLSGEYQLGDIPFAMLQRVQKPITAGRVVIADESGRILSIYAPDESIPAYKRIKITGLPDDCQQVNIRAARRYFPLFNEFDVVESDNQLGFIELAHYFRLNDRPDKTGDDLRAMQLHLGQSEQHFRGQQARELGKGTRSEVAISSPQFVRNHSLRRNRRF